MDIPKALWREVLNAVDEENIRQFVKFTNVKLNGYRKGKAPRSFMVNQLLQPDNFRYFRYGLNSLGKEESFEIDYSNLSVEEVLAETEANRDYSAQVIVCHMFASEDENVRLRGADLWERIKTKPAELAEPAAAAEPALPQEEIVTGDGTALKRLQKKYNDLKENREKDRREWDKQRTNLQSENNQLKQELKQTKADLQRAEQEKKAAFAARDKASRELAEKQDKIGGQALKIIELEKALRSLQEQQAMMERPAPEPTPSAEPVSQAARVPIAVVCGAEWAGKLDSAAYAIEYVTPDEVDKQVAAGLLERVEQVWVPRSDLRMTDQRMVRNLIPKDVLRDLKDINELKKQL